MSNTQFAVNAVQRLEVLERENAALREQLAKAQSEYICTCGIRVTPHKCPTDNDF
jgi:hypothetical protein